MSSPKAAYQKKWSIRLCGQIIRNLQCASPMMSIELKRRISTLPTVGRAVFWKSGSGSPTKIPIGISRQLWKLKTNSGFDQFFLFTGKQKGKLDEA